MKVLLLGATGMVGQGVLRECLLADDVTEVVALGRTPTGQQHPKTTRVYEYAEADGDPYYPIPRAENAAIYKQYQELADLTPGVHFVGRLGTYKYYNMDQVVGQALATFSKIAGKPRSECVGA